MNNRLYCGASKVCITPPAELLPNLYGLMGQSFGGVLDDLYARVIAVRSVGDTVLLISCDLDKVPYPAEWIAELAERFDIPEENVLYASTHTHTAPLTDPRPYDGPNAKARKEPDQQAAANAYEDLIHTAVLAAADEAVATLRPARFGYNSGESYINVCRNQDYTDCCGTGHNGAGDVDRTLSIAGFEDEDGNLIAYLLNYAVHNVIMLGNKLFGDRGAISSDLGGGISKLLEQENPGAVALWTSGAAGDVNPIMMNLMYYPDACDGSFRTQALAGAETMLLQVMTGRHMADVRKVLSGLNCTQTHLPLKCAVQWSRTPGKDMDYEIRIHGVRLGEVVLCGFSGELYTSFARQIKALSPFKNTLIVNHDATFMSNADYILDDDGISRDALGMNHSFIRPGYVKDSLDDVMPRLFAELTDNKN